MIARVFPRKTSATPVDSYAFVGDPPLFLPEDITGVHVSVVFTWDLPEAERLARAWARVAPVKVGGPATGMRGGEFKPGMYLKYGYVITSRGCPNNCWFCSVPRREGREVRELEIHQGSNVLDDNLLACSKKHFQRVLVMLKSNYPALLTGGLEAARLKPWHVEAFEWLRPKRIYFAYDTTNDLQPLVEATKLFQAADYFSRNTLYCYVLVGYPGDTMISAEHRLNNVVAMGMTPMAMLYRDEIGKTTREWRRFQTAWARPAAIYAKNRNTAYLNPCSGA
jgi:hypothetical protein